MEFSAPGKALDEALAQGEALRVGEASVVSTWVHTVNPLEPGTLTVVHGADAGRAFYHREGQAEIVHADVFHLPGEVRPEVVAAALRKTISIRGRELRDSSLFAIAHLIDIQTALGGGRITGSLVYGRTPALAESHGNHVHLAIERARMRGELLLRLIDAAEQALLTEGLKLGLIEHLVTETAGRRPVSMDDYATHTDSFLKSAHLNPGPAAAARFLSNALRAAGGAHELEKLMTTAAGNTPLNAQAETILEEMAAAGLMEGSRSGGWKVTPKGEEMAAVLSRQARAIEREVALLMPPVNGAALKAAALGPKGMAAGGRRPAKSSPNARYDRPFAVDIPGTVVAAGLHPRGRFRVSADDLRFSRTAARMPARVCLLVDGSVSMRGEKLAAAKEFAADLLSRNPGLDVAVIVFQESGVRVEVPFTRNRSLVKSAMSRVEADGLTPLGRGLRFAVRYLTNNTYRTVLMLLSDGVPTLGYDGGDPMEDALSACAQVRRHRLHLCCIGLGENTDLVKSLAQHAGGRAYIVPSIDLASLRRVGSRELVRAE
jgi:magnesium chelatase subunit D